jgi:hypothetical protein
MNPVRRLDHWIHFLAQRKYLIPGWMGSGRTDCVVADRQQAFLEAEKRAEKAVMRQRPKQCYKPRLY